MMHARIAIIAVLALGINLAQAATLVIINKDAANEGLSDPAPFIAVGGNNATTLGEARMNVLREAARIWGALLQSSVQIDMDATFDPLTCSSNSGTLGSAGPRGLYRNFKSGLAPDTYYVSALANALNGAKLPTNSAKGEIVARFNSAVDSDANCLGGRGFYYGFDHNRGQKADFLLVVLHEMAHGLGFTSNVHVDTGKVDLESDSVERFDSYTHKIFDEQFGKAWPTLTEAERLQSAARNGVLAWDGSNTNAQKGRFSQGVTSNGRVRLYAPTTIDVGSSVSHFDLALVPVVLMRPSLSSQITTSSTDITVCAMQDIGWTVATCPHYGNSVAPVAIGQSLTTLEDTPLAIALNATDADNNALTFTVVAAPSKGSLTSMSGVVPSTVTYTPTANANGADSFTFTVTDGVYTSALASVNITITAVNDAPVATAQSATVQSGQNIAITLAATDIEADVLSYQMAASPVSGTVSGTAPNLRYTPNSGFSGSDSFTFVANDGKVSSAAATVAITVTAPPAAAAQSGGGGGGALSGVWLSLLMLFTALRSGLGAKFSPVSQRVRANR